MLTVARVSKGDRGYPAADMNAIADHVEQFSRLMITGGTISKGSSGTMLHIHPGKGELIIAQAGVSSGSYPTFNNSRKVFPVKLWLGPSFDEASPTTAFIKTIEQVPAVNVYNIPGCWIFEDEFITLWELNGQYWTNHYRKYSGVAGASISKGSTGNVTVMGTTITARAKFGATVSGNDVSVYWDVDAQEWVIDAEECA